MRKKKKRCIIISPEWDSHSDILSAALSKKGIEIVRFFTNRPDFSFIPGQYGAESCFVFRRANTDLTRSIGYDIFVETEIREMLSSLPFLFPKSSWFPNTPFGNQVAGNKIRQILEAKSVGLVTPETFFGNNLDSAKVFLDKFGRIVSKPFRAQQVRYRGQLRRLGSIFLESLEASDLIVPSILQEYIKPSFEMRVICVNGKCFFFKQEVQDNTYQDIKDVDLSNLQIQPVQDIWGIAPKLQKILGVMGLIFCAADFLVTHENKPVFLELNPNGQWYYLQEKTGVDLLEEVVCGIIHE